MKKKPALDQDEEELIAEYERGAFRPVKNQNMAKKKPWKPPSVTRARTPGSISAYRPPTLKC